MVKSFIAVIKKSKFFFILTPFVITVMIHQVNAQGRCDLVSEECLDMTELSSGSGTIEVPSNTTRLSAEGVSICLTPAGTEELPTDMVFVVDQSGSMNWNDPTFYAPTATKTSVRKLYELSPNSIGGLVPFSGSTCSQHGLYDIDDTTTFIQDIDDNLADGTDPSMDTPTLFYPADVAQIQSNWTQFQGTSGYGCGDTDHGTNYVDALTDANTLIQSGSNTLKAIIFITDGEPSGNGDPDTRLGEYNAWIAGGIDIAPVYSIFIGGDSTGIGDPNTAAGRLVNLANLTGGGYFSVDANDPIALENIMQFVVQEAIAPGIPSQTTVVNTTLSQTSTADSLDHTDQGDGLYQVTLDNVVGLVPNGTNSLSVTSISVKNGVFFDTTLFNLTINTTGTPNPNLGDINLPDSLFDITCVEPSTLVAVDNLTGLNPITILDYQAASFSYVLESTSGVSNPPILIESQNSGDTETSILSSAGANTYNSTSSWASVPVSGTSGNNLVESRLGDQVVITWWHPRDSSDFAADTFAIQQPKVETPQASSTSGNPFISSTDIIIFTATADPVTIYYTLDGSTPNTSSAVYDPLNPFSVFDATTIRAYATKTGWLDSDVMTYNVTRTSTSSSIALLENSLGSFPNDVVTSDISVYALQLFTNYFGNDNLSPGVRALGSGDTVTLSLATTGDVTGSNASYARIYTKTSLALNIGAAAAVNSTLETNDFDTLIVTWVNPLDASDVVRDTIYTRPVNTSSQIFFSTSSSIDDTVSSFNENNANIFIIVTDQEPHPDSIYTVSLVSGGDVETVTLSWNGTHLVGSIPLSYDTIANSDNELQAKLPGDAIQATYVDPIYSSNDLSQASVNVVAKTIADPVVTDDLGSGIVSGVYFLNDTTIRLTIATPGANIRYTIDGSTVPSNTVGTLYTPGDTIIISNSTILRVIGYLENDVIDNFITSNLVRVILNNRDNVGLPWAVPAGSYFTNSVVVTLFSDSAGDTILYTIDGTTPNTVAGGSTFNFAISPIPPLTGNTTIKFRAVNLPKTESGVVTEVYTKRLVLDPPIATPGTGTIFSGSVDVTLSHATVTNAVIRYTTDGSTPTDSSDIFISTSSLTFTGPTTLKAIALNPPGSDAYIQSAVATFTYTPKVATPTATPGTSNFGSEVFVQLNVSTLGANIYYTLDGSTPTTSSTPYTQVIRITQSDTLRAIASKNLWADSDVLTVIYTKDNNPSSLVILDANQQEVPYFTEKNTSFITILSAAEADLSTTNALSFTISRNDSETVTLQQSGRNGDYFKFLNESSLSVNVGLPSVNSGGVEAHYYDQLIVTWTNPNNPLDVASDTVLIRPFPTQADMYFTNTPGSDTRITEYNGTEDSLYIVIKDQVWNPDLNYTVTIETTPVFGENRTTDQVTLPVVEISPGVYGVVVPVDNNVTSNTGDGLLQIVKGDIINANYVDPVDGDSAETLVYYGGAGEVQGKVMFTNASGVEITDGAFITPGDDSLYITYIDDYTDNPKELVITVKNTTGTGLVTFDTLRVDLGTAVKQDSVGTWTVAVPLAEAQNPDGSNGVVEVFFRGDITATVQSHTKDGAAVGPVQDKITAANPNEEETVDVIDDSGTSIILRESDTLTIILEEQNFTSEEDTLLVNLQCLGTGDILQEVMLIEQEDGTYQTTVIKNEEVRDLTDGELSCLSDDQIKVTYIDPIYGTDDAVTKTIFLELAHEVYFIDENGNIITNLDEYTGTQVRVKVEAVSESQTVRDTLQVTLVTSTGETVVINVYETDVFSGEFESDPINYTFLYGDETADPNELVVGTLDGTTANNTGTVTAIYGTDTSSLVVDAAFVPVERAWIIDGYNDEFQIPGSDGRADTIFIKFVADLPELPGQITDIKWPGDQSDGFTADHNPSDDLTEISFYVDENGEVDRSILVVVLKGDNEEFPYGITSTGEGDDASLVLPDNSVFKGQKVEIEDEVNPVIIRAVRLPSDLVNYEAGVDENGETIFKPHPDSMVITFSEDLKLLTNSGLPWDSLVMFSASCNKDSGHFLETLDGEEPIVLEPDSAGNPRWLFVITDEQGIYKPTGQGCVWLNPNAQYTDLVGNNPSNHDVDPEGLDNANVVKESYIFLPIIGNTDPDGNEIAMGEDPNLLWVKPYGIKSDGTTLSMSEIQAQCGDDPPVETQARTRFDPNCLSAVYVESQVGYKAHIDIYDHLGKFVHSSVQYFGLCGELENNLRRSEEGYQNWLVWNQKNIEGSFVGSGVYIYRVRFLPLNDTDAGAILPLAIYKQGIARSEPPAQGCAD